MEGNYDQAMKSEQRSTNQKTKLGEVWVALNGLIESSSKFEPLVQDCRFELSLTFTVHNSTFINKHSFQYCQGKRECWNEANQLDGEGGQEGLGTPKPQHVVKPIPRKLP